MKREYSFFSVVYHTFNCIDYFLVDDRLLSSVSACKYDTIFLSDHVPVSMSLHFKHAISTQAPQYLNTRLLSNEDFIGFVS